MTLFFSFLLSGTYNYFKLRYSPTTTSHTCHTSHVVHACLSMDRKIITRVPTNSHACKTRVIPTRAVLTRVPYIFLVLSVCKSRLLTQFYKSNATSALEPVSKIYCYRRICQCCGLLACLSLIRI